MLPAQTIRGWHLGILRNALASINHILHDADPQKLHTLRDGGTGWTVTEVVCHLRDYEAIFLERVMMMMTQNMPDLLAYDADKLALDGDYNSQDVAVVYADWVSKRQAYLDYLEDLAEEDWSRTGKHPTRGVMTIQDHLALSAWHDINHLEQMTRILKEARIA
jgi:uncharacterized damage-inducible protein DinB